ncbi:MAG: hypothetical protein WAV90_00930 [Gordonia amarae]
MNETLTYTVRKVGSDAWEASSDAWPLLKGEGATDIVAITHLKQQIAAAQPCMFGLYETSDIGARTILRGVCSDESFARSWVAENDETKTWESRSYLPIPLLGGTNR